MYFHKQELQYDASPDHPDALMARRMQEILGGQYGEISVMMQYMFQGLNTKLPGKYKDMIQNIGTEEMGHVEMIATMIARLLERAPISDLENHIAADPTVAAVVGGMDVQQAVVAGAGARPTDSRGNPWNAGYIIASGNLMADFHANANAEMQGRLQVARLYEMTSDSGVRDMLAFLLARDTMHQNQWLAAIQSLRDEGIEDLPVPSRFDQSREHTDISYQYWDGFSDGPMSAQGPWAAGPAPDGKGTFTRVERAPSTPPGSTAPPKSDPRLYGTAAPDMIELPKDGGGAGLVDKVKGAVQH